MSNNELTITKREIYHSTQTWQPIYKIETYGYGVMYAITFLDRKDLAPKFFVSYEGAFAYGNAVIVEKHL